jgi:hypothetical protein
MRVKRMRVNARTRRENQVNDIQNFLRKGLAKGCEGLL